MASTKKIVIGVVAVTAGLAVWYYNAAINLSVTLIDPTTGLPNIQYKGANGSAVNINLRFAVTNTSMLPFFTPRFTVNIYDSNGNLIGTGTNPIMQGISGNAVSFVDVDTMIPYSGLAGDLAQIIQQIATGAQVQLPTGVNYKGAINLGINSVQLQGSLT